MKGFSIIIFLFLFVISGYSQNKFYTVFSKDSIVSVQNYVDKFDTVDSLVVRIKSKKLIINEELIMPFFNKNVDKFENLGICPFATAINYFDKNKIIVSAKLPSSFGTSLYAIIINKNTGKLIKIVKVESARKLLNGLSILKFKNRIVIPKNENFIQDDTIEVLLKNKKSIQYIKPTSDEVCSFFLGGFSNELDLEKYFTISLKK